MALYIKDSALACPATKVLQATDFYKPFPSSQDVAFNDTQLLPVGLLAYSKLDANSDDNVLIALPISMEIFDGDLPYISYSLTDIGWQVDAHNVDNLSEEKEDFEDYSEYYQQAASFYAKHQRLNYTLDENDESVPLFEFGGQPILGCNWDAYLWDEEGDDETRYFDAMDEQSGENYSHYSTREIGFFDEEHDVDFAYLGTFCFSTYFEGGGEGIVFYSAKHKRVLVIAEFS